MKIWGRRAGESIPKAVACGAIAAVAAELVLAALLAAATLGGLIGEEKMPVCSAVCVFIGTALGGLAGALNSPKLKLPAALAVGAVLLAANFAVGRMLGGDGDTFDLRMPLAIASGALTAGLLSARRRSNTKKPLRRGKIH